MSEGGKAKGKNACAGREKRLGPIQPGVEGEVGRRARRLELAAETGARPESAGQSCTINSVDSERFGVRGKRIRAMFEIQADDCLVCKSQCHTLPPKHQSACGVSVGPKGREQLGDRAVSAGFTEDAAGQQDWGTQSAGACRGLPWPLSRRLGSLGTLRLNKDASLLGLECLHWPTGRCSR